MDSTLRYGRRSKGSSPFGATIINDKSMQEITDLYRRIKLHFKPLQTLIGVPFMVGGGCIGDIVSFGKVIKDYDFFFKNYDDMDNFEKRIKEIGFRLTGESEMGRNYSFLSLDFDIIAWQVKEKTTDWVKQSDFTVNSAILDGNELCMHRRTFQDCQNKQIVTVCSANLLRHRIKRYVDKGYHIPPESPLNDLFFNRDFDRNIIPKCEDIDIISTDLEHF